MSNQALRVWPSNSTSTCTLYVYFRFRTAEGVGLFNAVAGIPDLTLVAPQGRTDSITHEAIREAIVAHLLNNAVHVAWRPENMTQEAALRSCLREFTFSPSATSVYLTLLFDGEFGPVRVG